MVYLQMENARLRAELATAVARDCVRSVQLAGATTAAAASAAAAAAEAGQPPPAAGAAAAAGPGELPAGVAGAQPLLPPGAAQKFERAMAVKDELVVELQVG